jgi:ribosome-binding factor A
MASKRIARLNEQLKRELSELIRREVRDPRIGPVSVTRVQVSADLSVARVFVLLAGSEAARVASLNGLDAAAAFLRRTLGRMLRVRRVPELRFQEDRSLEHARRIESILDEVLPEQDETDGTAEDPPGSQS